MKRAFLPAVLSLGSFVLAATPSGVGSGAIREADIAATVRFLSSPELEGRHSAERGGAVASAFIAARFAALGWLPAGDVTPTGASYYQSVAAVSATWDRAATTLRIDGSSNAATPFVADAATGILAIVPDRAESVAVEGPIVFAGFGIRAPELEHDDYAGLGVRGKVVLVLSGEPPGKTTRPTRHSSSSAKRALAGSLGAVALIIVPNPAGRAKTAADLIAGPGGAPEPTWLGLASGPAPLPMVYLDREAAERALGTLPAQRGEVTGRTASLRIGYRDRREVTLRNVVARLGTGRGLDGEVVLVGAHFDHVGTTQGVLHPGADDNASGVAGLLAAAEELASARPSGTREIVFAAWTGEENGRLGSLGFAAHPVVPLERIATAINLDMLGRNNLDRAAYANVLQVIYSAGAPVLRTIAAGANAGIDFDLRFYPALRFRPVSDHHTFAEAGVPILYPFSGYHDDYHGPGDSADKVLPARIARAARYLAQLVRGLAKHEGPIKIDPSIHEAPAADPFETPYGG